jgi:uncharacterized membrane protein YidH (DUF202 family)
MDGLLEALSVPYVFPHEGLFVLGVGLVIVGLLVVRAGLARRLRNKNSSQL